ncbi:hypothetical protein TSAR_008670 [Trichomalopsis sarcophagae]|uniref:Uncharacterized protein n=1 Tax=Trichomalopsis sarcophagae TaxID=543379 RepID=A0A232F1I9_9HYME|nr:hypothetical protein TSAR_008670 [Trichomalopsis sarcophagae]
MRRRRKSVVNSAKAFPTEIHPSRLRREAKNLTGGSLKQYKDDCCGDGGGEGEVGQAARAAAEQPR